MELKNIEIVGFKSFADRLYLTFDGGITVIVGPNGSGKSNIADAIRWVLGEQSAKQLRGSRMEDVIFAGTERRRPLSYAQVTLTLDNSDRGLAYDFDEVAISRKMYRSGESEYMINGVKCRLIDVKELLMDTGIGKDGYSIIGQGRIDQLLSNNPQDRRLIFEEAAGIVKYKTRRDEANKKLAEEEQNLVRVTDVLNEASSRIEPLAKQAETAKSYIALSEELKTLELQNFMHQYSLLMNQHGESLKKLEDLNAQLESARAAHELLKERSTQLGLKAGEAAEKLASTLQEVNDLRVLRESTLGEKNLSAQRLVQLQKDICDAHGYMEDVKARMERRAVTLEKEKAEVDRLQTVLAEQQVTLSQAEAQQTEAQQAFDFLCRKADEQTQQREDIRAEAEAIKSQLTRQEALSDQFTETGQNLTAQIATLEGTISEKKNAFDLAKKAYDQAKALYDRAQTDIEAWTDEISELRTKRHAANDDYQAMKMTVEQLRSRVGWISDLDREYEGYANSVKTLMTMVRDHESDYPGVHGTIAELISVPQKYATAIDIALGNAVQDIVVDTQATAKELIEYLHTNHAGRATFLPISEVRQRGNYDAEIVKTDGILGYAHELIDYDESYAAIFSRLLGNVILAKDYDVAAKAARKYGKDYRFVTLRGDLFNIGGSITGGTQNQKSSTIMDRKGEMDALKSQLKEANQQMKELEALANRLEEERNTKVQTMNDRVVERDALRETLQTAKSELDQAEVLLHVADENFEQQKASHAQMLASIAAGRATITQLNEALREKQAALDALISAVEETKTQREAKRAENERLRSELLKSRVEVVTSEQLLRSAQNSVERAQQDEQEDRDAIERYRLQISDADAERETLEKNAVQFESDLDTLAQKIQGFTEVLNDLSQQRDATEREHRDVLVEVEKSQNSLNGLEKEAFRLDAQESHAKKDLDDLSDRIWEKYEMTFNAAKELNLPPMESASKTSKRIDEIHRTIRDMGPVNINAVAEYDALVERCAFLRKQVDDVTAAADSLKEIIRQLTEQMEKQFEEGFATISAQFNKVFGQMFNGGTGQLVLSDTANPLESGIEIIAQPPGKKLKSIAALSGGERALTAIAILFAIQQLKPAPFCILDEIEAALDDTNVRRYADYLKTLCHTTQFVVITHRKGTMESATTMYGITMEEKGISKCVSVKFE